MKRLLIYFTCKNYHQPLTWITVIGSINVKDRVNILHSTTICTPFKQTPKPLPLAIGLLSSNSKSQEIQSSSKAILSKCSIFVGKSQEMEKGEEIKLRNQKSIFSFRCSIVQKRFIKLDQKIEMKSAKVGYYSAPKGKI